MLHDCYQEHSNIKDLLQKKAWIPFFSPIEYIILNDIQHLKVAINKLDHYQIFPNQ